MANSTKSPEMEGMSLLFAAKAVDLIRKVHRLLTTLDGCWHPDLPSKGSSLRESDFV